MTPKRATPKRKESPVAVVTGGTQGIGAAIATAFHDAGYLVVIAARRDNGFTRSLGRRALFHAMDVVNEDEHAGLVAAAVERGGRLDVFVNGAGVSAWRPLPQIDAAFWHSMIEVNLTGALWGAKAAAAALGKGGVIINVSSLAGKRGSANNAAYCAAKFGLNGLTQSLAKELGPRGIRVNAVCPVYVRTAGLMSALESPLSPSAGRDVGEYLEEFAAGNAALKRLPEASEVGDTCVYLASARASAITGQCINVDCGVLPQ